MEDFAPGDIVEHQLLEVRKVIVGAGRDRYLCVHLEDVREDGRVRVHARVAMHRGSNLRKIGFRENVTEVSMGTLYQKESSSRRRAIFLGVEGILAKGLLIVAAVMIVLAILSGIDYMRNGLDGLVDQKINAMKSSYYKKTMKEYEKMGDAEKEQFKKEHGR